MMTCPRCYAEFEAGSKNNTGGKYDSCPECGISLYRNVSGIVKTSIVMISTNDGRSFYHSVSEMPEPLRRKLMETTSSANSGTIVIADRAGKEQLTEVLSRRDSQSEALAEIAVPTEDHDEAPAPPVVRLRRFSWLAWVGFLVVLTLAAVISVFFGLRW